MKKIILFCGLLLSLVACEKKDEVHLLCKSSTDSYDVIVRFLNDGAMLTVNGQEYELKQQYDARVAYYRFDPWYNFQIGNRDFSTKYSLGVLTDNGTPFYTPCEEKD